MSEREKCQRCGVGGCFQQIAQYEKRDLSLFQNLIVDLGGDIACSLRAIANHLQHGALNVDAHVRHVDGD